MPDAWKYGGGATWQNGSYDPELDLVYWGTGNAEPYNPEYRGGADSLYTASVIAIRPKTGELVWHYQYIPNESFDFDGIGGAGAGRSARSTDKCARCCSTPTRTGSCT